MDNPRTQRRFRSRGKSLNFLWSNFQPAMFDETGGYYCFLLQQMPIPGSSTLISLPNFSKLDYGLLPHDLLLFSDPKGMICFPPPTPSTSSSQTFHHEACKTCSRMQVATMCESTWKAVEVVRLECCSKSFQVVRSHLAGVSWWETGLKQDFSYNQEHE